MSQQSNTNRGIQSYFRPVARAPAAPRPPPPPASSSTLTSPPTSPPSLPFPAQPSSTPPAKSPSVDRNATPVARPPPAVIEASDDEGDDSDGDSDDSLEDLGVLLGRERPAPAYQVRNPFATPRSKRTAVPFPASPLDIISKHKFDLKALAKDARRDDATNASSMRVKAAAQAARQELPSRAEDPVSGVIGDIVKDGDGKDAQKVLRTVQRTAQAKTHAWCCFFDRDYRVPPSSPPPKVPPDSPWRLLTQGNSLARERCLASGVPQTILAKRGGLPDNVFQWILDELCVQKSCLIRHEYCNIIASCPEQVERLLVPGRLGSLCLRLGASQEIRDMDSELVVSKPSHEPYQDRDWSCVVSFLGLLAMISRHLSVASAIFALRVLLRLALDKMLMCNMEMLTAYEEAVNQLTNAIPESSWDPFCFNVCSMLHASIKQQFIRANALLCIPIHSPRSHDLRRRLAVTYLFDDHSLARQHPEQVVTIKAVVQRLAKDDFSISPQTDHVELKAVMLLLDMVVDDGSATVFDDLEDEKRFNEDVDELVARLGEIWRKINDAGMKLARTETKGVVEWVQQRLAHSVRTRRKVKKDIYGVGGDTTSLPRQQELMKRFLQKSVK